jgi:hypothetical protein
VRWNWRGALGPLGAPFAGDVMDAEAALATGNTALCFDGKGSFSLAAINASGITYLSHGTVPARAAGAAAGATAAAASSSSSSSSSSASGATAAVGAVSLRVSQSATGVVSVTLNGEVVVPAAQLQLADLGGGVGVHCTAGATLRVSELQVIVNTTFAVPTTQGLPGSLSPSSSSSFSSSSTHGGGGGFGDPPLLRLPTQQWVALTASDGVVGAGAAAISGWQPVTDAVFRRGSGYTSAHGGPGGSNGTNATRAKWSFVGVAVRVWLPRGPQLGSVWVSVDGCAPEAVVLTAATPRESSVVFEWSESDNASSSSSSAADATCAANARARAGLLAHAHAVAVRWRSGVAVVDTVEFLPPPAPPTRHLAARHKTTL